MKCNICGGEFLSGETVCRYCGNIVKTEKQPEIEFKPPIKEERKTNRVNDDVSIDDTRIYKRVNLSDDMYCSKCGRPLDGITKKCIVCDSKEIGRNTYVYRNTENGESIEMAQKRQTKKKKNTARNIILMIIGMIILFSLTLLFSFGPLSEFLGIGGMNTEETPEPAVTQTHKPIEETWEPQTDPPKKHTQEPTPEPTQKPKKTQVPLEEGDPVEKRGGKYEYKSNTNLITTEELESMSRQDIKHIYWEIYARHGYTFDGELADYFENNHQWYVPLTTDIEAVEASFNDIEKRNLKIIYDYQKKQGWR